jgi:hypothetical protein
MLNKALVIRDRFDWNMESGVNPATFAKEFVEKAQLPLENIEKIRCQILEQLLDHARNCLRAQQFKARLEALELQEQEFTRPLIPIIPTAPVIPMPPPQIPQEESSQQKVSEKPKEDTKMQGEERTRSRRNVTLYNPLLPSHLQVKKTCFNCGNTSQIHGDDCRNCLIPFRITMKISSMTNTQLLAVKFYEKAIRILADHEFLDPVNRDVS